MGETLLYLGIGLMGASALGGAAAAVIFAVTGRRLRLRLNREYGEKKR